MSIVSRVVLAGLVCAAISAQAVAAPTGDDPGSTRGRLLHASKCVMTLGFSGGCDKDQAESKRKEQEQKEAAARPAAAAKAADDTSTRHQFMNASRCVVSLGFVGDCDKNAPPGSKASAPERHADATPAAPDNSTGGQLKRATACVVSFGFVGDCERK